MASATASPEAQALIESWRTETDMAVRDDILAQMEENKLFPIDDQNQWETDGGVYPDLNDPNFLPKLLRKREFQESKQKSVKETLATGEDKCRSSEDFELSSVQRFVSRILSPRTPYNSFLLYHGVGVGKTCAAITVCESYLEAYPGRKVYIVAPPNIQEGFRRTIFDKEGLKIGKGRNSHRGCTGDIYLSLTNTYDEKDIKVIESRVSKAIRSRYEFFGYTSFYNHIRRLLMKIPPSAKTEEVESIKRNIIQTEFSNRCIIIDEAHNLRDIISVSAVDTEEDIDDVTPQDTAESKGGKRLTPYLKQVLEVSEGITLLLMTATPMYNSYTEIVFLLNLLLINDKFPTLDINDVFDQKTQTFNRERGGRVLLGKVASCYISFMRGENPLTFPLRLEPAVGQKLSAWPKRLPSGQPITAEERERVIKLPCIGASFSPEVDALYKAKVDEIIASAEGLGITNTDLLIQAGNWIFPSESEDEDILSRVRQDGFDATFEKEKRGNVVQFRCSSADWLLAENLPKSSAKCAVLLDSVNKAKGVVFVYSRFVPSGALSIALALEANGYTNATRAPLLVNGNQRVNGRQCALCERSERGHGSVPANDHGVAAHSFKPAKYVLLTGSEELSPDNAASINASRTSKNIYGEEVKVILGSQIAGEGLDLRYVRNVIVFDSWYHLNKLEQIIGRGIRNCSHAALPEEKRNCTVSLLVNKYIDSDIESIDMYSYRTALRKAIVVGNVTRVLKENAMDCTLNREAILVDGLDPIDVLDSQGNLRKGVNRNDVPLTPMCDWLDTCDYSCYFNNAEISANIPLDKQDTSTYDEYTARFQINTLRRYIENLFGVEEQMFLTFDSLALHFNTIPRPLLASLMEEMVQQKEFRLTLDGERQGRLLHKNGFYIFQPDRIKDTRIPIAIRVARIPIMRDEYVPKHIEQVREVEVSKLVSEKIIKKVAIGNEDSEALWEQVLEWVSAIRDGKAGPPPAELLTEVSQLRESTGIYKAQKERIDMIMWIYENIKEHADVRSRFADCVTDFFWDEFITFGTKRELLNIGLEEPNVVGTTKDMVWILEGETYIRIVNYNNEIEYLCVKNKKVEECSKAVSEVLAREVANDPLLKRNLDSRFTGYEYGFIIFNPKKSKFVFKNGKPPGPGGKVGRGSECAINSKIDHPMRLLERFGESLRAAGFHDLGLNEDILSKRRIQNSIRICTVCDLVLRYMDKAGVQKKRWFYRPLEAKLHGHPLR
jgi:hypothetical protein